MSSNYRDWLKIRLAELQMSAQDLADACEKHIRTVRRWLSGDTFPSLEDQITIAMVLGLESAFVLARFATECDARLRAGFEEDDLKRRTLLAEAGCLAASNLLMHGFSALLRGEERSEDEWRAIVDQYGRDYMVLGADDVRTRVATDLSMIQSEPPAPWRWAIAAKLMTLYAKTFPGSDGQKAASWYVMATQASDLSEDITTRVWVRGRAAIALGYEGAALPLAHRLAHEALAIDDKPSIGRLNALMGAAHVQALRGDSTGAGAHYEAGRRTFDIAGSDELASDYAVPGWRQQVFSSLLLARLGRASDAIRAQAEARAALPPELMRFATHLELHTGLMLARAGDLAGGIAYAQAAMDRLPADKHSITLRMLVEEIKRGHGVAAPIRSCRSGCTKLL